VRAEIADVLAALATAFRRAKTDWFLFGAQAVHLFGVGRFSEDIDVTVQPGTDASRLVEILEACGFQLRIDEEVDDFVAHTRVLPFLHRKSGVPIDVVLAGPGPEEGMFARRRKVRVKRLTVPVASPEDLVLMKVLAGRPKDLEDIRGLLTKQGRRLKVGDIRRRLRDLEAAIDQSDLLPLFERLLGESRGRKR
jgi:hypothetical protein